MIKKLSPKAFLSHFRVFPVTLGTIWLFTLLFTFFPDGSSDLLGNILFFIFYYGSGSFFIEALFLQKKRTKWFYAALAADLVPASLLVYLWVSTTYEYWDSYFMRYSACYFLILFSLGVYLCYQKLKCTFAEYLVRLFGRMVRYHITYIILLIGISMIACILVELFNLDFYISIRLELLLFGLYYMSSFLLSFYPSASESSLLTDVLIKYILTVMVIIAYAIVYAYMLKILILWDIPSNAIFRITAGLFLLGMPVCFMNGYYQDSSPLCRVVKWLPTLFLPFILLQGYSIGIRIWENGVTPMRYAAAALLVFECIAIAVYHCRRPALGCLLPIAAVFVLICGCLPFVNLNYVSYISQKEALERYLSQDAADTVITDRMRGAYSYLRYDYLGRKYMDALPEEQAAKLELLSDFTAAQQTKSYYANEEGNSSIPVAGYTYCYSFELHEYDRADEQDNEDWETTLSSYPINLPGEVPDFSVDLDALLRSYMSHADGNDGFANYFRTHRIYQIDDNNAIYLDLISVSFEESENVLTSFRVSGYLLRK